ncbi:unnamed protein product [Clonostachys chloroleuca]|uniref:Uncharacterized protein n=1 Tax=Clonostachys chloroleuca TaxID=1926264 RepID=A0AA35M3M2_9HYPO|nr:unnamed protein product [Clonostachys chloroleuca]CAI6089137.1 unnamed protein product [Clonostachys chloroleuca]
MTDLESGLNDRLYHLDKAAPERSYEEVMDDLQHAPAGEHLAWPDSFYECSFPWHQKKRGVFRTHGKWSTASSLILRPYIPFPLHNTLVSMGTLLLPIMSLSVHSGQRRELMGVKE